MIKDPHKELMAANAGFRDFVSERLADAKEMGGSWEKDEAYMLGGFADWLAFGCDVADFAGWTAEQFRGQYDFWNS